jgi:NTE family protein
MKDVTLVCGGGGVWGVAWMTGIAIGLAEAGLDLREADSFIGTSAGSIIGTQLASDLDPGWPA